MQIIHTWAEFARERDLQFFTAKHLEDIAQWADDALALLKDCDTQIQYRDDHIAMYHAEIKRLEDLLKEQETELSYREAKAITHTATKLDDATCPSCGNVVGEKIRTGAIGQSVVQVRWDYCRFCGQKLDWEGR